MMLELMVAALNFFVAMFYLFQCSEIHQYIKWLDTEGMKLIEQHV